MLSVKDNELLTRVTGDAPMGKMMRQHWWIPAIPSEKLVVDGTPQRIQLFGERYVAYRATDGRVGFIDEACPHRGASMALARNEENGLRCIYHGWKFSIDGTTVAVPTQPQNEAEFCKRVPLNQYPSREVGGIVWVWLGEGASKGSTTPPFPEYVFSKLPAGHTTVFRQRVKANWLQGVETTMDSAHLGVLHQSYVTGLGDIEFSSANMAPVYEVQHKPYGFRYAAIRALPEGRSYVRANSFVLPWYGVISPPSSKMQAGNFFFSVPIDDENIWYWHLSYQLDAPQPPHPMRQYTDADNWPPRPPGDENNNWGQNREVMQRGHFTGFPQSLGTEDFAVIESMGPIVDRSKEFLGSGDGAVVQVRRCLLKALQQFMEGKTPDFANHEGIDYPNLQPLARVITEEERWQDML